MVGEIIINPRRSARDALHDAHVRGALSFSTPKVVRVSEFRSGPVRVTSRRHCAPLEPLGASALNPARFWPIVARASVLPTLGQDRSRGAWRQLDLIRRDAPKHDVRSVSQSSNTRLHRATIVPCILDTSLHTRCIVVGWPTTWTRDAPRRGMTRRAERPPGVPVARVNVFLAGPVTPLPLPASPPAILVHTSTRVPCPYPCTPPNPYHPIEVSDAVEHGYRGRWCVRYTLEEQRNP